MNSKLRIPLCWKGRSGGAKSLLRVSRPRQTLEALFLDIVEKARAERLETAGAHHGGQTAAFLKAQPDEGGRLIESLVRAGDEPPETAPGPTPLPPPEPEEDVIGGLLQDRDELEVGPAPPPGEISTAEVDLGVIDSLLESPAPGDHAPDRPGGAP